jgi:anti-sigma B factor antagonist
MSPIERLLRRHCDVNDQFDISEEIGNAHSVVKVVGELDVATAPQLQAGLEAAIGRGNPLVVADLLDVTFIDSTALGVLISCLKQSSAVGATLNIVASAPRILKVFEITGLTDLFAIFSTVGEALNGTH